jgi:hypothetical protein
MLDVGCSMLDRSGEQQASHIRHLAAQTPEIVVVTLGAVKFRTSHHIIHASIVLF